MTAPVHVTIFSDIFGQVDSILQTYINGVAQQVITVITPIVTLGLTLWLLWYAVNVILGHTSASTGEFFRRLFMWSIVLGLALSVGNYQSGIGTLVRDLPGQAASALVSDTSLTQENTLGSVLDNTADKGIAEAKSFWNQPTGHFAFGQDIINAIGGADVLGATLVLCIVGFFMLALATVMVSFLAAIGPIFIVLLLFDATARFFWSWVSAVAYWVVFMLFFALIVAFVMQVYQYEETIMTNAFSGGGYSWVTSLFALDVVALLGIIMFFWIPKVSAHLTGGPGGSTLGAIMGAAGAVATAAIAGMGVARLAGLASKGAGAAGAAGAAKPAAAAPRPRGYAGNNQPSLPPPRRPLALPPPSR